jgi:hypothetical protein
MVVKFDLDQGIIPPTPTLPLNGGGRGRGWQSYFLSKYLVQIIRGDKGV